MNIKRHSSSFLTNLGKKETFLLLSIILFILFWFSGSIPLITEQLLRFIPLDTLLKARLLHPLTSGIGPGKRWFIEQMCGLCIVVNFILLFLSLKSRKGSFTKIAIFCLVLPLYGIALLEFKTNSFENHFNEMSIENYKNLDFDTVFKRSDLKAQSINSFDDFYVFAHGLYQKKRPVLESGWGIKDSDELKSIFYMNLVSGLWVYGNKINTDKTGCVLNNEITGLTDPKTATIKTYLNSSIGCCTDYAYFLNFLLDKQGIKNRVVNVRGHVFNEAFYNNQWHALDANINVVFHDSWMNITFRKPNHDFKVSLFPHHNSVFNAKEQYRKIIGKFRYEMLTAAVKRNLFPTYSN